MSVIVVIHSYLRWLVLLIAVFAAVKFAIGWLRASEFKAMDRGLAAAFSGAIDLQALLGIILLLAFGFSESGGGFPRYRLEHAFTMILAAVLAHLPARWKKAADGLRFRNSLFCILGVLVLIYVGVSSLPGGWTR